MNIWLGAICTDTVDFCKIVHKYPHKTLSQSQHRRIYYRGICIHNIITLTTAIASESDTIMSCMESIAKNDMLISKYTTIIIGSPSMIALGRFL